MIPRELAEISESDLLALVDGRVSERIDLEFKAELQINADKEKREFLADVSCLANTQGGDLIFGITQDDDGCANGCPGLDVPSVDELQLKIDAIVRAGIEARLPGVRQRFVKLANGRYAIVIRVDSSWLRPHRVTFAGHGHYYARSTAGKYQMDVDQLRASIVHAELAVERVLKLRQRRISAMRSNQVAGFVSGVPTVVLHVIPLSSASAARSLDIAALSKVAVDALPLPTGVCWDRMFTADGFRLTALAIREERQPLSIVQVSRNGLVEQIDQLVLPGMLAIRSGAALRPSRIESKVIEYARRSITILRALKAAPPALICLSVLNVEKLELTLERGYEFGGDFPPRPFDRKDLILPHGVLTSWDSDVTKALREPFDGLWNAAGMPSCPHYSAEGVWRQP